MPDHYLPVVVHGVGSGKNKDRAGFSKELSRDVHEFTRPVTRVGPFEKIKKVNAPNDPKYKEGMYWQEALWESENNKADAVLSFFASLGSMPKWLTSDVIDLVSDVPLYLGVNGQKIRKTVRDVIVKHPNCIVVSHSLGSVIAADILIEAHNKNNFKTLPVSGLITLGSPLNFLGTRKPMNMPFPFKWKNYYYPSDPIAIGGGLKKSKFPGVINHKLTSGATFGISHTAYWYSAEVAIATYRLSIKGG